MMGVQPEFLGDILPAQRLMRAAAQMRLPLLDNAAVLRRGADMAGIVRWIGIARIDDVLHFFSQCQHPGIADRIFTERAEANAAIHEGDREEVGGCEFGCITIRRPLLVLERLPKPVHRPLRHLADDLGNVLWLHAARGKPAGAIDVRLRHRTARYGLNANVSITQRSPKSSTSSQ